MSWRFIPILLFLVVCLFLWRGLSLDPPQLPSVQVGKPMPAFTAAQLQHSKEDFSLKDFHHQPALLNVWASWCDVCQQEQVVLMQLASQGLPIYGLNYKDKREDALRWLDQWGNPYRLIGQDVEGKLAIDLGVYGVPETFVIDKKGIIRYRQAGMITQELWLSTLQPLIKQLDQE
jgi:cytochrome c biogenesis protein CcmG, thiol:disulfide interchange protein DsbE